MMRRGKWKDGVFGTKGHELLVFSFFLVVSFAFWLLQALNETLEREVKVRLALGNIPADVVIIDSLPPVINVTLQGKGLTLARQNIYGIFHPRQAEIDFAKYDSGNPDAEVRISLADTQRMIGRLFSSSTRILSFRPDTLSFSYNRGTSRLLPVRLAGKLNASSQNYIQSITIEPDSVRVYAPASMLDTMQAVYTVPFMQNELHEPTNRRVALLRPKLQKCEPAAVEVRIGVGYYTEKTVRVPVIGLNFPADKKLRTFPAEAAVTFRVESGRFHSVTSDEFVLATTYEELIEENASKLQLHLKTIPAGVSNVRITPAEVDYLIETVPDGE